MKTKLSIVIMFITLCFLSVNAFAAYQVGDVVDDLDWLESDSGTPANNSIHDIIDQGKVVVLKFSVTW